MKHRPSPISYPTTDENAKVWGFDIIEPVGTPMAWIHDWTSAYAGWNRPMQGMMDLGELLGSMGSDLSTLKVDDVMAAFCLMYRKDIFGLIEEIETEVDRDLTLYFQRDYWGPEQGFAWVVGAWMGWSLGTFVYATLGYARRFSDLAGQLERIDLLDLHELAPFARQGLRSALLWLVLLSLVALNALDLVWFSTIAAIALMGGTAALILPVRGIHVRLRQAKQAELERVHAAIRGDPGPLSGSLISGHGASLGLSDLLAYRKFLESVREWPFDSPTLLRFALYPAIPLGSWLGGAFVERLLGAALD